MLYKGVAFAVLMSLTRGLVAEVEYSPSVPESINGGAEQDTPSEPSFYTKQPFFDLESLLECSDELREQYVALSDAERAELILIFDQFNDDFQKAFHSVAELEEA